MPFLPPQVQLALAIANLVKKHGNKALHSNNIDLLTQDLSNAMKQQKDILSNPKKGVIMTAYDVIPVIIEVKILTLIVAKKNSIDTKGKPMITVLEEIIQKSEERGKAKYANGIKDTLEWTRALFDNPEIQDILKMDVTAIEKPKSLKELTKFFTQLASRSQDELTRVNEFLKRAKDVQTPPKPGDQKPQPPATDGPAI